MSPSLRLSIRRVLLTAAGVAVSVSAVAAETAPQTSEIAEVVIVTGSFIRGTAEDAALPVDVISSEELEKQGSPSPTEMLKSSTVMNGIISDSNQFTAGRGQAAQGSASINLRGFGAERTLTLLNGKRLASEDANLLPSSAIARVEILKEGGAVTYGSDAIGGVVNFITKERIDGLELGADYRHIEDSDGDYNASIAWGTSTDRASFYVAADYMHRSELLIADRDWALTSRAENPLGGWSTGANPGAFRYLQPGVVPPTGTNPSGASLGAQIVDPACGAFGGDVVTVSSGTQCQTQYTQWLNLVEEQDTYRLYSQLNFDVSDSTQLHVEAFYAYTHVPEAKFTPSFTTTRRPTETVTGPASGGALGLGNDAGLADPARTSLFYVPASNPGFIAARAAGLTPANAIRSYIVLNQWRPFFAGGNPTFDNGASESEYEREQGRFSAELTGEVANMNWTVSGTYALSEVTRRDLDISTGRLQLALRGLGGPDCNVAANTPGQNGCQWFNPFSNAVAGNPLTGYVNPDYNPAVANSVDLVNWMQFWGEDIGKSEVLELDAVVSGEMGLTLPGGAIGWAAGAQYRHNWTEDRNNAFGSSAATPCPDTLVNGDITCAPLPESPYNFLATYAPNDLDRGVYAVFSELSLPITDTFNAQVAARFEDYGNKGGSSFDPKVSLRWQATDWLAFRGSAGTTFRAPPMDSLLPEEAIAFQSILGSNRPVATVGNPDLEPEEAFTWSAGVMLDVGNFRALVDFWRFDIDKLLTVEPSSGILGIVFPNGTAAPNNCATVDPVWLDQHFDFAGGVCDANNILKVTRASINGAGLVNDGVDITTDYTFDNVLGGSLVIGASATWIHTYETETLTINGVVFQEGFDGTGKLNQGTTLYALPEWRAQGYVDYSFGRNNLRWTANYVDAYRDQRYINTPSLDSVVDSTVLHNLTFRTSLPGDVTLLATVDNIFDEDPSFALMELNYDPLTGNPLGRTFKIGLRKSFN